MVTRPPARKPNPGYFVQLNDYRPSQKRKLIMALRKLTGVNASEAEDLITTVPIVLEFGTALDGEHAQTVLMRAGAECYFGAHESYTAYGPEMAQRFGLPPEGFETKHVDHGNAKVVRGIDTLADAAARLS
jgi:hypothetical protein